MKVKMLIYGSPGCGKTVYVGSRITGITTIPEACPVVYLDFDNNTGPIRSNVHYCKDNLSDLDETKLNVISFAGGSPGEYNNCYNKILRVTANIVASKEVKTVILDSATNLGQLLSRHVLANINNNRKNPGILSQEDYGIIASMQAEIIDNLYQSDKNAIVLCHTHEEKNKAGVTIRVGPSFIGAYSRNFVPSRYHFVGHYRVENKKRGIAWADNDLFYITKEPFEYGVQTENDRTPQSTDFRELQYLFQEN